MIKGAANRAFTIVNGIIMIVVMAICLFPFLYVLAKSLSSSDAIMQGKVLIVPIGSNIQSFKAVLEYPGFFTAYRNTIVYTLIGTFLTLFVTIICAYPLSKKKVFGRNVFMKLFIVTMFFSGGLIPNFVLINKLGLVDSMWAIVLPAAFDQFYIILAMTFIQGIPVELEESAAIDGLNPLKILVQIILPLAMPVIATVALFTAVSFWNEWFGPMIYLNSNDKYPVMLLLRNIITGGEVTAASKMSMGPNTNLNESSIKSAAIILVVLPIVMIYPFLQKYFVKGAMIGSLKG